MEIAVGIIAGIIVLGLGILIPILILKSKKQKKDVIWAHDGITTSSGLSYYPSIETLSLKKETMEEWLEWIIDFWYEKKGWDKDKSREQLKHIKMFMYDEIYLVRNINGQQIKVNGITYPNTMMIEIATLWKKGITGTTTQKVHSLVKHEVSHVIAGLHDRKYWDGEASHDLFQEVGLGA